MPKATKTAWEKAIYWITALVCLSACSSQPERKRPLDPWAFHSVLDKHPRMLTVALDTSLYMAYDLSSCTLYKAWKGGVLKEGTVYNDKKIVQPLSWGTSYIRDTSRAGRWTAMLDGRDRLERIVSKGYTFRKGQIFLQYQLILSTGDTVIVEERPEYVPGDEGEAGIERLFSVSGAPAGLSVQLRSGDTTFTLAPGADTRTVLYFPQLPHQIPVHLPPNYNHRGRYWMEKSDCFTCHELDKQTVGPAFLQVAMRYRGDTTARGRLARKIREGGSGNWGSAAMNPHPAFSDGELNDMVSYILGLRPDKEQEAQLAAAVKSSPPPAPVPPSSQAEETPGVRPGYGSPLTGVHPGLDLTTLHSDEFQPRVGGMAFLPDGRLAVSTWDSVGAVYLVNVAAAGGGEVEGAGVEVKRIAAGLAEPLGLEVVNGDIYVLQKQELTRLRDLDGDDVIDRYETICNSWGATADFHEFSFGLVYRDGYFYATLSMAMRLMSGEHQLPDRGRTIRIDTNGHYESVNYGLRTPNGIGLGPDSEIFVTDNQGQWLPANKLIHVRKGTYNGMAWGLPDSLHDNPPPMTPPAVWLPQDEIGNSPSEPVLIPSGPYQGQLLHGDVSHGGIKRDFLEKVNGSYQGAVFRFTQGLAAGVNRLCWGPDGALYVGEVGMTGGWSWQGKRFGLQRLAWNGKPVFEMLAIRVKPSGFEIQFTEPVQPSPELQAGDFLLQQWRYVPTASYGGPKIDLETLKPTALNWSQDRTRLYLELPGLKSGRVVYFRLPASLESAAGRQLWSNESWYTLNRLPAASGESNP